MKWNLGFPAYLIADGEYPVLLRGQEIDSFALEFHPRALKKVLKGPKDAKPSVGCDYGVVAEVLYASDEACLIDFGLLAACSLPGRDVPREVRTGDYVAGVIYVGIPLCISANITPLVEAVSASGRKFRQYDQSRLAYENAESTNTGAIDYALHCELID